MPVPLVTVDVRMLRSSGIGTYLRALLPRLVALMPDVRFCLLGDLATLSSEPLARAPNVECRALRAGVYSPLEQVEIPRAAPPETRLFWSPNVNVPLSHPGRLLVTVHDAFYLSPPRGVHTRLDKRVYLGLLVRRLCKKAATVLCVSDFTRQELERHASPSCPIAVVRSGVEPHWFEKPGGERPWPKPYFVFVGNLKPHKNLPRTLAAFARIASRVPHDFLVIGAGQQEEFAGKLDPRIATRVHFLGPLNDADLKRHVAHAAGLVLASLYEGFGLPPLEAMALGVPVLVSKVASLPEVCGSAALYCDPRSIEGIERGLQKLLLDERERARLAAAGPENARRWDWDRAARESSEVVRGLLQ